MEARPTDYELVLIKEMNGRLAYEAHPSGQPSATFLSTMASDSTVVFENPEHDFPQRVGYRREGADSLQAWIEGQANGKSRRVDFAYQRARCEATLALCPAVPFYFLVSWFMFHVRVPGSGFRFEFRFENRFRISNWGSSCSRHPGANIEPRTH